MCREKCSGSVMRSSVLSKLKFKILEVWGNPVFMAFYGSCSEVKSLVSEGFKRYKQLGVICIAMEGDVVTNRAVSVCLLRPEASRLTNCG